jgi:hypothetical protein
LGKNISRPKHLKTGFNLKIKTCREIKKTKTARFLPLFSEK